MIKRVLSLVVCLLFICGCVNPVSKGKPAIVEVSPAVVATVQPTVSPSPSTKDTLDYINDNWESIYKVFPLKYISFFSS